MFKRQHMCQKRDALVEKPALTIWPPSCNRKFKEGSGYITIAI